MSAPASVHDRVLGCRPLARLWSAATRRKLRVLTYHDVANPVALAAHLDELVAQGYTSVTGPDVDAVLSGRSPAPARAVWITFDDGAIGVAELAQPLLDQRGLRATAFVCAGLLDTDQAQWWTIAERAEQYGLAPLEPGAAAGTVALATRWKRLADPARRARVVEARRRLVQSGHADTDRQWTAGDVGRWVAAGHEIGNHSWDHPCLDQCAPDEQVDQVRRAHDELTRRLGHPPISFAWPNGDPAPAALATLDELGYRLVLACDHRLTPWAGRHVDRRHLSRLRIDSDDAPDRFRAVLSGGHSAVFHLRRRVRR